MSTEKVPVLNAIGILDALAADGDLADEVMQYLNVGMLDEWDVGLAFGLQIGFGNDELAIAARAAAGRARYDQEEASR